MRVEPDDPSDSWSEQVMLGNLQVLALTILMLLYLGLKLRAIVRPIFTGVTS